MMRQEGFEIRDSKAGDEVRKEEESLQVLNTGTSKTILTEYLTLSQDVCGLLAIPEATKDACPALKTRSDGS